MIHWYAVRPDPPKIEAVESFPTLDAAIREMIAGADEDDRTNRWCHLLCEDDAIVAVSIFAGDKLMVVTSCGRVI